ncbi:MAG: hypothetical protein ACI9UQ_002336, partial [Candidatus Krumholzibacteriia bacterium]
VKWLKRHQMLHCFQYIKNPIHFLNNPASLSSSLRSIALGFSDEEDSRWIRQPSHTRPDRLSAKLNRF